MHRSRLRADDGFTLVELLVVTLIVGILAAIGLATLLNQRGKAQDAEAKTTVVTGAKAIEAYATDHGGDYADVTPGDLSKIEPSLGEARNLSVTSTATTYTVSVDSAAAEGAAFTIERIASGHSVRSCALPGIGGCGADADANGNRW
jgi:prepilin-type N-terminal cleavage/methylation domain-containing protein